MQVRKRISDESVNQLPLLNTVHTNPRPARNGLSACFTLILVLAESFGFRLLFPVIGIGIRFLHQFPQFRCRQVELGCDAARVARYLHGVVGCPDLEDVIAVHLHDINGFDRVERDFSKFVLGCSVLVKSDESSIGSNEPIFSVVSIKPQVS